MDQGQTEHGPGRSRYFHTPLREVKPPFIGPPHRIILPPARAEGAGNMWADPVSLWGERRYVDLPETPGAREGRE